MLTFKCNIYGRVFSRPCVGVTLTVNIDLTDRLANGQLGILYNIPYTESQISKT